MKKIKILILITAIITSAAMLLSGCGQNNEGTDVSGKTGTTAQADTSVWLDTSDMFTDRDLTADYDDTATKLELSDGNPEVKITEAGTYVISGSTSDGSITVDVSDDDKVQIVLSGVSVTSKTGAALYVKSADKVFITLADGTKNTLANGGAFGGDDDSIDGAVFSKSDIVFGGSGTLTVISTAAHGIVGKDDVKITGGTYEITCGSHGIDANDSIRITGASLTITAGKDGLHCDNTEDSSKGFIYIKSGELSINADDDGIHATTTLQTDGGTLNIKAAEGLEATRVIINDGTISIEASDDGINAAKKFDGITPIVQINGGKITIVMGPGDTDGVDSNGDIIINGGTVDVTGNSSFDYDGTGTINGGTVIVNGEEVTTLPNQFMGGPGGNMGGGPGGMRGGTEGNPPSDVITSATPEADGNGENGTFSPPGNFSERPQMPDSDSTDRNKNGTFPQKPGFGFGGNKNADGDNTVRPERPDKNT